jgi:alginate O-acetyltransferase complex protein AlgI
MRKTAKGYQSCLALIFIDTMLFNSLQFACFFIGVLLLYYALPHRWQNRLLFAASYFFYGCWDWRFLGLILISTSTDFLCSLQMKRHWNDQGKWRFLAISVVVNVTILGFFKYWNFFAENLSGILSLLGLQTSMHTLSVMLPVGISFYTFKTISYSVDVYRGDIEPSSNLLDYALFVSFFPQLVAGPIERAKNLLPQIAGKRRFNSKQFGEGLNLIFWGLFKKVFVADNLGLIVDQVYGNPQASGIEYIIATWAFAFQIYGDFSGYSDMAQGLSKCMGFEIMQNFRQPYAASDPSDFWRRWHISLSTWLRDYLYISLGGNKKGYAKTYRNLMVTMLLGGLWHGAAWNFVFWGGYHGLLLVLQRLVGAGHKNKNDMSRSVVSQMVRAFFTFQLVCIGWIFFRAKSLDQIFSIVNQIIHLSAPDAAAGAMLGKVCLFSCIPFAVMVIERMQQIRHWWFIKKAFPGFLMPSRQPIYLRSFIYGAMMYLICFYGLSAKSFIYMQF